MPQLEPGFYWVRFKRHATHPQSVINWFEQIGPRIEPPLQFHAQAFAMVYSPVGELPKE